MPRSRTPSGSNALREHTFFTDRDLGKRFPELLRDAGFQVEAHAERFSEAAAADSVPDTAWLPLVGRHGWVLLTHDRAMRYTSRERDAIMKHGVRAFMLIGTRQAQEHAENFIRSWHLVERALRRQRSPFIAKLHHPTPRERHRKRKPTGRVEIWLSWEDWSRQRR
jgi:hypothetical protein